MTDIDPSLAQVEIAAQRAADLCRQLLAYAGKGRFVIKPLDLNLAVTQSLPLVKLSISKKVTLDLQLAEGLPPFRGDPTQINQILMNLALNASEAIGDRVGTITLRTSRTQLAPLDLLTLTSNTEMEPGPYLFLEVVDTGCGIPPEAMGHIFEPFFSTKFVGRGLGLAAVLGIMQGHRGGVRVESQPGAGTTFTLFFPVQNLSPAALAGAAPPLFAPTAPARGTVLVVDDEEAIRHLAQSALTDAGFTVVLTANGEEALDQVRRNPTQFDAVLLDLTMPKLDGEDTLMALRMIAPSLPVVLTSGFHEQSLAQRFVGRGLADFLPKPFRASKLVALLAAVIAEANDRS
jgi:CheY-like chemotaxis protein